MNVDLDAMVPIPNVGGASTNGGYCGPAVKPIAMHMIASLARHPEFNIPISGIGGVGNWRDAAEFIALGATNVQVCTAVMHYGYRIVEDMASGLSRWMDEHGYESIHDFAGLAARNFKPWEDLNMSYKVVAKIDQEKCIGCQLCYVACRDGSHECIYIPGAEDGKAPAPQPGYNRVPWVAENECTGCNLCSLVCPVDECITMTPVDTGHAPISWKEYQAGKGELPAFYHK
jgi:dihydropyrimidine dehydrogenase (NAD+) subunit PreA